MKRIMAAFATVLLIAFLSWIQVASSADETPYRTIRGAVYEDVNGDGLCFNTGLSGEGPVPQVNILFANGGSSITLFSGSNGTFGLAPAGLGTWQVTAMPDPAVWRVTSPNPLRVTVAPHTSYVQTGANFCVYRHGGNPASVTEAVDPTTANLITLAALSEFLLASPPEPIVPENIEETLEAPVEENATPVVEWLSYLNLFREMGGLPILAESGPLTHGSQWHSRYMVVNDRPIAHAEDPLNLLYDQGGDQAAKNGNIFATTQLEADHVWSINFWISAPFHLVPILDPELSSVGYGRYNEAVGRFQMAAVLDVRSELGNGDNQVQYPLYFPGDGSETWVVRHNLFEWPNPVASCGGYARPTGAPLVLQLGDGSLTPNVTGHALFMGDKLLESCRFDETSYRNSDTYAQGVGRTILGERDAIVILPKQPLQGGQTFTVQVEANGQTYSWQFSTRAGLP